MEKKNWRKELYHFLLNYWATRHTTTTFAPAGLLFNREMNTKLPINIINQNIEINQQTVSRKRWKRNMKINADKSMPMLKKLTVFGQESQKHSLRTLWTFNCLSYILHLFILRIQENGSWSVWRHNLFYPCSCYKYKNNNNCLNTVHTVYTFK